jgi:AraC-like DNA-binding protein
MPLAFAGSAPSPTLGSIRIESCGEKEVGEAWSVWEGGPYRTWNHCLWHVLDGGCTLEIAGREWRFAPGSIHVIPGHRFARRRTQRMLHRWINFNLDQLSADLHLGRLEQPLSLPLAEHRPWAEALAEAARVGAALQRGTEVSPYALATIEGCLLQVVALIGARVGPPADAYSGDVLRTALAYIERHYRRMPALAEIAAACGRSPNHLQGIFSAAFGVSPTAYARECRMREAVHQLISTALKVQDIARACGYEDPLHFSRVFSRFFGSSPLSVRENPQRGLRAWTTLDHSRVAAAFAPRPAEGPPPGGRKRPAR